MNRYEVVIEDIYEKSKTKKVNIDAINVQQAHKTVLLSQTNALREEISKITSNGNTVYTFRSGFSENV